VGQSTACQQAVIFLSGRVEYRRRLPIRSEFTLAIGKTQRAGKDAGATNAVADLRTDVKIAVGAFVAGVERGRWRNAR
jgi:hypothetical protein